MSMLQYPKLLNKGMISELQKQIALAESSGSLTSSQLQIIYEEKWFKLFVPECFDGLALDLVTGLQLQETLARIDGSLGWTVTLCSGATMFVGFIDQSIADKLFSEPRVCFGGSGMPTGTAEITNDGYLINGCWKYATGAPHNTVFTANCRLIDKGLPVLDQYNEPKVQSFFFMPDEVFLKDDWNTMGLIATAGFTFTVENLYVEQNRTFILEPEYATIKNPLYQYPFISFAEITLAVNTLGMTQHFLELCQSHFLQKKYKNKRLKSSLVLEEQLLISSISEINALRSEFYSIVKASWAHVNQQGSNNHPVFEQVGLQSRKLVKQARSFVAQLYPFTGMYGVDKNSPLNRVWRDIFTASQHSLLL